MRKDYSVPRNFSWIENYKLFKVARRVQVAYLKEQNQQFFTVFQNKFLKHVFNIILKLNNHIWKKLQNYLFVEKMKPKSVVLWSQKKFQGFEKKIFWKKIPPANLCGYDLQNDVRKFYSNKWFSRYSSFGDFKVPNNYSSQ